MTATTYNSSKPPKIEPTGSVHRTYPIDSKRLSEATGYAQRTNRVSSRKPRNGDIPSADEESRYKKRGQRLSGRLVRRSFLMAAFLVFLLSISSFGGETVRIEITEKISQSIYPKSLNACGPTCLLMQFRNGTPKMKSASGNMLGADSSKQLNSVIDRYFKTKRSVISPELYRWGVHGVLVRDMEAAADDWMEEIDLDRLDLSGMWLDRDDAKEKDSEMVRRIHRRMRTSLKAGVPPILSLKTFVAREKLNKPGEMKWRFGRHHYVLVNEVPDSLIRGDEAAKIVSSQGFKIGIVDPSGGLESEIFAFHDSNNQPFNALKGNDAEGRWIAGKPFLQVAAPTVHSLTPANLKWSERVVTIANYLIGKF